jgi:uncharacterized protein (UPF0261 family)
MQIVGLSLTSVKTNGAKCSNQYWAAGAICGIVKTSARSVFYSLKQTNKPLIALIQFRYSGVCYELARQYLGEQGFIVIPCHGDGVGDRAMEKLLDQGIFDGAVDIAPSGLSEQLLGGDHAAGPDRIRGMEVY